MVAARRNDVTGVDHGRLDKLSLVHRGQLGRPGSELATTGEHGRELGRGHGGTGRAREASRGEDNCEREGGRQEARHAW